MMGLRGIAIVLLVAGALALAYGGFTYTKTTHRADLGPIHLEVQEKERVNIPLWAGLAGLVVGALMLAGARRA